ncbi:hypothetical protein GCM10010435_23350 [Winogradskya consettensis]|uniref:Uncharacterized protein n=1 Tax=Winogradskya consettensis TaxID=113560 RepID=A0A919SP79_9ACTN|nr:hypothetical protein [Actinoplanes consettensis]GIM75374.1 hypothetical protein Aco04nite_45060 [Actinoplanes consettensis]
MFVEDLGQPVAVADGDPPMGQLRGEVVAEGAGLQAPVLVGHVDQFLRERVIEQACTARAWLRLFRSATL